MHRVKRGSRSRPCREPRVVHIHDQPFEWANAKLTHRANDSFLAESFGINRATKTYTSSNPVALMRSPTHRSLYLGVRPWLEGLDVGVAAIKFWSGGGDTI
jgi:hypothetical protein